MLRDIESVKFSQFYQSCLQNMQLWKWRTNPVISVIILHSLSRFCIASWKLKILIITNLHLSISIARAFYVNFVLLLYWNPIWTKVSGFKVLFVLSGVGKEFYIQYFWEKKNFQRTTIIWILKIYMNFSITKTKIKLLENFSIAKKFKMP